MDRAENMGRLGRWDVSKRSPDERRIRGTDFPHIACAHAGYTFRLHLKISKPSGIRTQSVKETRSLSPLTFDLGPRRILSNRLSRPRAQSSNNPDTTQHASDRV
jgi:hypothetical protein